jgi:hypothetical protein
LDARDPKYGFPFLGLEIHYPVADFLKALHLIPLNCEQSTDSVDLATRICGNIRSLARFLVPLDKKLSELPDVAEG